MRFLAQLFDPNYIRKSIKIHLPVKFRIVKYSSGNGKFLNFEVDLNDHIGWKIFIHGYFDQTHLLIADSLDLSGDDIFMDIGANVGSVSIPIAISTGCEIIAIEANHFNSYQFLRNVSLNPIRVNFFNCAVVDPVTHLNQNFIEIFSNNGNLGASSIYSTWNKSISPSHMTPTPTAIIDNLIKDSQLKRIKLVKIDIEGSEMLAFKGFEVFFDLDAPLVFEYRIDLKNESTDSGVQQLPDFLYPGFVLYAVELESNTIYLQEFRGDQSYENVIAFPKNLMPELSKKFNFR